MLAIFLNVIRELLQRSSKSGIDLSLLARKLLIRSKSFRKLLKSRTDIDKDFTEILLSSLWSATNNGYIMSYSKRSREMIIQRNSIRTLKPHDKQDSRHVDRLTIKPDAEEFVFEARQDDGTVIYGPLAFENSSATL